MKIFLCILWVAYTSLAIPAPEKRLFKKNVLSGSENGANLIEPTTKDSSSLDEGSHIATDNSSKNENGKDSLIKENSADTSTNSNVKSISGAEFRTGDFEIGQLALNHPTIGKFGKSADVSIDPLLSQEGFNVIKVPEVYVLKVPQVVLVKETDFLNGNHHAVPTITGPYNPFEIPSLTQAFPSGGSIFQIPSALPSYPIEAPQAVGQFPVISVGSEIPVISDIGGIPQGIQVLNPEIINTIEPAGLTDEKIDHGSDTVTVEALGKHEASVEEVGITAKKNEEDDNAAKSKDNTDH